MDLRIEDLSLSFDEKKILSNINMHIKEREFVGIIGPNGSGKSTILRNLYRTLKPDKGKIYVDGKELRIISLKESARDIGVVAQEHNYSFDFKVMDMVMMGRSPHKGFLEMNNEEDYRMALESLERVGMLDYMDRYYTTLSGGEKQRVILARALTQDTNCLILDEPTNHLDIKYQLQIMNITRDLDITVIAAIHDLNMASYYCDRIYGIKEGRIIFQGRPEEVISPEMIEELYGVDAKIIYDEEYKTHNIIYNPYI